MRTALAVASQAMLALEPLSALDAVELAQAGQVLGDLGGLVLGEVLGGFEVGVDLIEIAR
jgi:hypothetical protein